MKLYLLLLLNFILILTSCKGQTSYNTISKEQVGDTLTELSNSLILIYQSADGKYWLGSDKDGLYCVDGKTIIHYSKKDGLADQRIRSIQEDRHGNLFIATLDGINKFDRHTFTILEPVKATSGSSNWKLQDSDLWFSMAGKSGDKGPYRYDGQNLYQLEFPKYYMEEEYFAKNPGRAWSPYEVYYNYKDKQGTMWFGTSNLGVCRYDGKSFSWLYEDHLTYVPNGGSFGIRSIFEDKTGKYWICNTRYRFNIQKDSIKENGKILINYQKEKGIEGLNPGDGTDYVYFMSATEDDNGNLWLATYGQGLWCYNGTKVKHYELNNGKEKVNLFSIYKDKKGTVWAGSHNAGAWKFNGTSFEKFVPGSR